MEPLDHVAVVVSDLESCLTQLRGCCRRATEQIGPIESFPSEGTREVYVGNAGGKLLLMQPTSAKGPYAEALAKRGPGLHHVALKTPDLGAYLAALKGWLLHPKSPGTIAKSRTAWLARPGVPTLVEVQEAEAPKMEAPKKEAPEKEALISSVEIPASLDGLTPIAGLAESPDKRSWFTVENQRLAVMSLLPKYP